MLAAARQALVSGWVGLEGMRGLGGVGRRSLRRGGHERGVVTRALFFLDDGRYLGKYTDEHVSFNGQVLLLVALRT